MPDVRNYTMNFGFGVTPAAPALAYTATSVCRRVLWTANYGLWDFGTHA